MLIIVLKLIVDIINPNDMYSGRIAASEILSDHPLEVSPINPGKTLF